ncbi:MAG: sn-glycerol-3-phosphate ABC transporter ATP-binding protein UgpC [Rhodobacteraceae bacterium]|nr:MAG: sn-glycerol-3-phosphate ABC transporter ATP-binding protein UgpC [Paracoccaceae bacterium]
MAGVVMEGLGKTYAGGVKALTGVDLEIADGEFVVLVGPSGCGKSTLLRMVAGLETITDGVLRIGDRVANGLEPAERDIAMVFQNYALYPHMTVYDNLAYGLRNRRTPKDEIDRRVREAARILEIERFLDRKPRALSGGQRQRVAMGRAIVRDPKVFLFDEPLSNLDAKLRVQMRVEIKQLQHRLKTTTLYVTHDQLEALTLGDRLVVMNGGRIEQVGTPIEVYDRPATTFVAGFIGSPAMNMLRRDWLAQTGAAEALGAIPAQTDLIGVRPDDLLLTPPPGPHLTLKGRLALFEPAGAESFLHIDLDGDHLGGAGVTATARVSGRPALAEAGALDVHVPYAALHPFDSAGRRAA